MSEPGTNCLPVLRVHPAAAAALQGCDQSSSSGQEEYDLRLHLVGVGLMLVASLAGALAPVALRLSSASRGATAAVRLGTYFGGCFSSTVEPHPGPFAAWPGP